MDFIKTEIEGVYVIKPKVIEDSRGYFLEAFSEKEFCENVREIRFVQENESLSKKNVIRGLHFQKTPYSQSKLIKVVKGRVLDVAVDIRKGSPTFGKHVAVELSEDNHLQVFIPRGFAHGFAVLSDEAVFQYKCDNYYAPEYEGAIAWNDPDLNIDWQIPACDIILSAKDQNNPQLKDAKDLFDYNIDLY